jgi:RimJ/RimL family protein N-acetyltransferase
VQLGCRRATFRTRADNQAAIAAMARLGAREEGRLRKYYPGDVDAVVFGLLKEDYPYGLNSIST